MRADVEQTARSVHSCPGIIEDLPMTRYYFDTFDGDHTSVDEDGIDCATGQEIQDRAIDALPDLARDELPNGPERLFWVKVRNEAGELIFEATLALASRWFQDLNAAPAEGLDR
jgi:hypothetical protein